MSMNPRIDRSGWDSGPWDSEEDEGRWLTSAVLNGYIARNASGAWCGYASVPESSALHGLDYDDHHLDGVAVHGGLTFAGRPMGATNDWYFGFDCAHLGDFAPGDVPAFRVDPDGIYRTERFATSEVEALATQLSIILRTTIPEGTALTTHADHVDFIASRIWDIVSMEGDAVWSRLRDRHSPLSVRQTAIQLAYRAAETSLDTTDMGWLEGWLVMAVDWSWPISVGDRRL